MRDTLKQTILTLPMAPGCYIFKSAAQSVLYVGKSKRVRSRVRQYFTSGDRPPKLRQLARMAADVAYVPAKTEIDALLLEYRLIKQYRPPYNSQMKNDEHPLFIRIDEQPTAPGLEIVPGPADPYCYGPFYSTWDADDALTLLSEVWQTPLCGRPHFDGIKGRPCLKHHIGKCLGPCAIDDGHEAYAQRLTAVCLFLRGGSTEALTRLKKAMKEASDALSFEQAAVLRDRYRKLTALRRRLTSSCVSYAGKRLCVFIKGYHEDIFLLIYIADGHPLLTERFTPGRPGEKLRRFASRVAGHDWDIEPDESLAGAVLEIRARKCFADITAIQGESHLYHRLMRAYADFLNRSRL